MRNQTTAFQRGKFTGTNTFMCTSYKHCYISQLINRLLQLWPSVTKQHKSEIRRVTDTHIRCDNREIIHISNQTLHHVTDPLRATPGVSSKHPLFTAAD